MNRDMTIQTRLTNAFVPAGLVFRAAMAAVAVAEKPQQSGSRDKNAAQHCGLHNRYHSLHIPPERTCRTAALQ